MKLRVEDGAPGCWLRGLLRGWGAVGVFFGLACGVDGGVVVAVVVVAVGGVLLVGGEVLAFGQGEGFLDAFFGGGLGVGLGVADGEGGLVLGDGFALAVGVLRCDVVEAAEVDVGPGEGAGILGRVEGLVEVVEGVVGVAAG